MLDWMRNLDQQWLILRADLRLLRMMMELAWCELQKLQLVCAVTST